MLTPTTILILVALMGFFVVLRINPLVGCLRIEATLGVCYVFWVIGFVGCGYRYVKWYL